MPLSLACSRALGATVVVGAPLANLQAGEKPAGAVAPAPAAAAAAPAAAAPASAPVAAAAPPPPAAAAAAPAKPAPAPPKASPAPAPPAPSGSRSENRVALSRMRLRIAQRLKESQNTAAMLTTFQEVRSRSGVQRLPPWVSGPPRAPPSQCDMSALFEMRDKYKDAFEKAHGVKLGFMSPFIKVLLWVGRGAV